MKINVIITGATGMVGEGVLHECLEHPAVESVLVINRRPCGVKHEKLQEIIHGDFSDLSAIEDKLIDYNACFFCSGVSSVGMKEDEYRKLTYNLTLSFAEPLKRLNPEITFNYVSGAGTDSTEKGRTMWARIKGKTENDLLKMFKSAYMFRPGYIQPTKGLQNAYTIYKVFAPVYPFLRMLFPNYVGTLEEIGLAMINSVLKGYPERILEIKDIRDLSNSK